MTSPFYRVLCQGKRIRVLTNPLGTRPIRRHEGTITVLPISPPKRKFSQGTGTFYSLKGTSVLNRVFMGVYRCNLRQGTMVTIFRYLYFFTMRRGRIPPRVRRFLYEATILSLHHGTYYSTTRMGNQASRFAYHVMARHVRQRASIFRVSRHVTTKLVVFKQGGQTIR